MTEQEKQEIIAEVKASVMDEHRCVCKPIILRKYPNFFNYILCKCAQCGAETMTDAEHQNVNYCSTCGCKLDWSDEERRLEHRKVIAITGEEFKRIVWDAIKNNKVKYQRGRKK